MCLCEVADINTGVRALNRFQRHNGILECLIAHFEEFPSLGVHGGGFEVVDPEECVFEGSDDLLNEVPTG